MADREDGPIRRLVLTAFGPFPGCPDNPTGRLAKAVVERLFGADSPLAAWRAEVRELPTEWSAPARLIDTFSQEEPAPDFVLALGVRNGGAGINVERVAVNAVGVAKADVSGKQPSAVKLVDRAAESLEGRLHRPPFDAVVESAAEAGHPIAYSDDAGRYVCNALFFHLLDGLGAGEDGPLVGFLHVPNIEGKTGPKDGPSSLPEATIVDGLVALVLGWCLVLVKVEDRS